MEHTWVYIGEARILAINSSRNVNAVFYGPNGWSMLDDWQLRDYWVINQIPVSAAHPYKEKFLYLEQQTTMAFYANAFDHAGELWKTWQMSKSWTEDPDFPAGRRVPWRKDNAAWEYACRASKAST